MTPSARLFFLVLGLSLLTTLARAQAPTYDRLWFRADSLAAAGLPQSALKIVDQISVDARKAGNYPQLVKAAMHRLVYRTYLDESDYTQLLQSLAADIRTTPVPARSVLQSVQAEIYWRYYQQNRYKFMNRSTEEEKPQTATIDTLVDPRSWDARKLLNTVSTLYQRSIQDAKSLQATPVAAYEVLLEPGDPDGRLRRPTLYDLLAHRALAFYQDTEVDLPSPVFKFELDQPAYLASVETFAKAQLRTPDSLALRFRALEVYQALIQFHLRDANPLALADVDNARLTVVHEHAVFPNKKALYQKALEQGAARYRGQPAEAEYLYPLARLLAEDEPPPFRPLIPGQPKPTERPDRWNRKRAADLCRELVQKYPATVPGKNAAVLLDRLLQPNLSLQVEEVNVPNQPFRALVTYQNVPTFYFRTVKLTVEESRQLGQLYDEKARKARFTALLRRKAVTFGTVNLPDDGDLHNHRTEIPLGGLPLGHYALLIAREESFGRDTTLFSFATLAVSHLGYIQRLAGVGKTGHGLYVTDRTSGKPLSQAQVTLLSDKGVTRLPLRPADGLFRLPNANLPEGTGYFYRISLPGDTLDTDLTYHGRFYGQPEALTIRQAVLFTDRAIYRPGQPVYVKGVLYAGLQNQYEVVAGETVALRLTDVNGETVASLSLRTNEFGTFHGQFTAPVGRVTGQMMLQTDFGAVAIRVEEYKRPTFDVRIDSVQRAYKLGQTITLRGQAQTYSGAAVDGAQVRYRITRRSSIPWYWLRPGRGWRIYPPRPDNTTEIANGTLTTDATGAVSLTFVAAPDRQEDDKNTRFDFVISLDVTDRAGETRTAQQTLQLGHTALEAQLSLPEQLETTADTAVAVGVTNSAGKAVQVRATVAIHRLQPPTRQLRTRLWEAPDRYILSRTDYEKLFPHDLYADEDQPASWPKGEKVQETTLTGTTPSLTLQPRRFGPGEYVAELTATDSTGETVSQQVYFSVLDPQKPVASRLPNRWLSVPQTTREVGQEAILYVGNGQAGQVLMTVAEKDRVVREEWLTTDGTPRPIVLPVREQHRGGFTVQLAMVQNGRLLTETQRIEVPFTNKTLTVKTEVFRDKLKPGQPEEWTLRIDGPDNDKVLAEMAAALYDASLDAFVEHGWKPTIYQPNQAYLPNWQSRAFTAAQTQPVSPDMSYRSYADVPDRSYDHLNLDHFLNARYMPRLLVQRAKTTLTGQAYYGTKPLSGLQIHLQGVKNGVRTDKQGTFVLPIPAAWQKKPVLTLLVAQPGVEPQAVVLALNQSLTIRIRSAAGVPLFAQNREDRAVPGGARMARMAAPMMAAAEKTSAPADASVEEAQQSQGGKPATKAASPVQPRRNFTETAFFFPSLQTDAQGRVVLKFAMPDALTRWKLLAFAHTKDLKTGTLEREIVTQKELMITANTPRFFREGDTLRLTARINNLSDKALSGNAILDLRNGLSGEPLVLSRQSSVVSPQAFSVAKGQSAVVMWTLAIPTGMPPVTVRITASAGNFSDAEEQTVPVLPNRMLVTETLPFWVNGKESRNFRLDALARLSPELPVQHERLTVEVTSNPAWYALQSLPYLMEFPYECAEQLFGRVYANALAAHILGTRPEFRQQVERWKQTPPRNPLEANAELKAVTLENTPWLRDARSQAEQQARLAGLLDADKLTAEQLRAVDKLRARQAENGGFRWFGGMAPDLTMTLHILASYGHLQKLGVTFPAPVQQALSEMLPRAVRFADAELKAWQAAQAKQKQAAYGYLPAQFLYARSFYTTQPLDKTLLTALQTQLAADWLKQPLQTQVLIALALHRFGTPQTPQAILASLRERAKTAEELGMYWPENEAGARWYQAPVETQAYAIEAFGEIADDQPTVDRLKQWLLRQKQTQAWPSTKATTEAVYALLLRGTDWLQSGPSTDVRLGSIPLASRTTQAEALTGYQKATFAPAEIRPELGKVTISKPTAGPAWGALYWQHFEPLDRVAAGSAGVSVEKTLFLRKDSPSGPVITALGPEAQLKPGEVVKVRLVLRTDRALEYVHLKDSRAAGFEPVAALSGYQYQNGLGYYQAPRDASTDFFLSYLPTGTHVFEYELRVVHGGDFSNGVATVQCFYAPEFAGRSVGGRVRVR